MAIWTKILTTSVFTTLTHQLRDYKTLESAALCRLRVILKRRIQQLKDEKMYKFEPLITSSQESKVTFEGSKQKYLNFCSNNYLGLSNHPKIVKAAKKATSKYGNGLSSVRFICGTHKLHKKLEKRLSEFHCKEDTVLYGSCFNANCGLFESLLTNQDAVFSDALNHASIIDGIRLCKAKKYKYPHRNMKKLAELLAKSKERIKMIVSDGVFSMDANVAPLQELRELATFHEAVLVLDDSHATGFFGKFGRGTEDFCQMFGAADIITSTLGKALGGAVGGYITGPKEVVDILRNVSRPYLFSNAPPPASLGGSLAALKIVDKDINRRKQLWKNVKAFRCGMEALGMPVAGDFHPICPIMAYDAALAVELARGVCCKGIFVVPFRFPLVPKGKARVRVQISAAHTRHDVKRAVQVFGKVGKQLGLLKKKTKMC